MVKLVVAARPRLVLALRGFIELVSVLIRLFIILVSNSRSRLCLISRCHLMLIVKYSFLF
jgi:hypothetical protein